MNKTQFNNFIDYLVKTKYVVNAPQRTMEGALVLDELLDSKNLEMGKELPLLPWKKFTLPHEQQMFEYKGMTLSEVMPKIKKQVLLGVSVIDLQALTLLNQVYEKDKWYQAIRKNTLVIGDSRLPRENPEKFMQGFEDAKLEHVQFDIFLGITKSGYSVFTGSRDGQRLLDDFGYKKYAHIQFAGAIPEQGPDARMLQIKNAMQNPKNRKKFEKIWNDLGKRCIQCGKCTIACPVCFCFHMFDQAHLGKDIGERSRCWDSCFYNEFTQVAGTAPAAPKHRFLNSTAEKIYFWYEHHFVRTPEQHSIPGCVGCGRCTTTCPAGIELKKVLDSILEAAK